MHKMAARLDFSHNGVFELVIEGVRGFATELHCPQHFKLAYAA
jgi:hypothetical protein